MKKTIAVLLLIALFLCPCSVSLAVWNSFRNESGHTQANTTQAQTPVNTQTSGPKWRRDFTSEYGTSLISSPVITETSIYVVSKNLLYELDKDGNTRKELTLSASMNSVCRITRHENKLFIPLSGGILQCVDISTMTTLWCSEAFGYQSLSTVYYNNDRVYAATTNAGGTDGLYYCLDASNGQTLWTYRDSSTPCGYYWSGGISTTASIETPATEAFLFGGDNGILVSHSLTDDTVYDRYDFSALTKAPGKIRAGITYDSDTNAYYTTTNNGYLYQIFLDKNGMFESVNSVFLGTTPDNNATNCTSTPTIYNGRIYVGCYTDSAGRITVVDSATMRVIYSASKPGMQDIKASPLVSTGYASAENHQKVYVYFTQNAVPGGIYFIEDSLQTVSAEIQTLYEPKNNPQFCLSSIAADKSGMLYYSNDSGTLFAIAEGFAGNDVLAPETSEPTPTTPVSSSTPVPPVITPIPSLTPTSAPQKTSKKITPKAPTRLRYKIKKKNSKKYRVTLSWKKGKNAKKTIFRIGKKTYGPLSGNKKTICLKKGTYTVCFYGYRSSNLKSKVTKLKLRLTSR